MNEGKCRREFLSSLALSATVTHSEMASSESQSRGHLSAFHEVISLGSTAIEEPPTHPPWSPGDLERGVHI